MMKMHGLGDAAYWSVQYVWYTALYLGYMFVLVRKRQTTPAPPPCKHLHASAGGLDSSSLHCFMVVSS